MLRIFYAYREISRVRFTRFEQRWNEGQTFQHASGNRCLHKAGKFRPPRTAVAAAAIPWQYIRGQSPTTDKKAAAAKSIEILQKNKRIFREDRIWILVDTRTEDTPLILSSSSTYDSTPWWIQEEGGVSYEFGRVILPVLRRRLGKTSCMRIECIASTAEDSKQDLKSVKMQTKN